MTNIQFGNNLTHSQLMTKQQLAASIRLRPHECISGSIRFRLIQIFPSGCRSFFETCASILTTNYKITKYPKFTYSHARTNFNAYLRNLFSLRAEPVASSYRRKNKKKLDST